MLNITESMHAAVESEGAVLVFRLAEKEKVFEVRP
jgi:hypothetical protein